MVLSSVFILRSQAHALQILRARTGTFPQLLYSGGGKAGGFPFPSLQVATLPALSSKNLRQSNPDKSSKGLRVIKVEKVCRDCVSRVENQLCCSFSEKIKPLWCISLSRQHDLVSWET